MLLWFDDLTIPNPEILSRNGHHMKKLAPLTILVFTILAACAPGTITPDQTSAERVTTMPYTEAFSVVVNTINTQPYPGNSGGWVITQSDQVGGFVSAELNGQACSFLGLGCTPYTASVSVALVDRGENGTAVNLSTTVHEPAQDLAARIANRLNLPNPFVEVGED